MMKRIDAAAGSGPRTWARRAIAAGLVAGGVIALATVGVAQNNADQVVAKIGSTQITRAMLRQEMPGGVDNPAIERAVLQSMINRKLLADEARRQGIDRTPIGAMVIKRSDEVATVGLLEQKLAGTPQPVSDAQVRDFVARQQSLFGGRRLIGLDQYHVEDAPKSTTEALKAANTMADFRDALQRDRIAYTQRAMVLDTLNIAPAAAKQIGAFGVGAVFITPNPDGSLDLSGVTSNTLAPINGASAERMARIMLQRSMVMQKVQNAAAAIVKAGQDDVKINPQYAPKKS